MDTSRDPANAATPGARRRFLFGLACAPFLALLVLQIASTQFLCDDAFILFRYARNLAEGNGLVFNRGERVEGFVDLLWVLELAGLWRLGLRPEVGAIALSLAMTATTLVLVVAAAARMAPPARRRPVVWIALGLVACSPSFAVWSTGGLETRQFTLLVLLGCIVLAGAADSRWRLLLASCVFGLAELTRPEGLLLFACAFAWHVARDRLRGASSASRWLCLGAPFVLLVAAQFLWRHWYYGDWLPNPYYAKHVQPWYDVGFQYLAAATIELGAWLWLPLAGLTMVQSAAAKDLTPALPFLLVFGHALYLLRIGGDHFEYRPLDFYLPLLAAPAAAGVMHALDWLVKALRVGLASRASWAGRLTIAAGIPVLLYSQGIGTASLAVAMSRQEPLEGLRERTRLDADSAPPLRFVPGLLPLCDILNPLRENLLHHLVAVPAQVHRSIGQQLVADYAAYERLPAGVFPRDAVTAANTVGVMPFYLDDLTVIDVHGLTDATVARTPVAHDNSLRRMAHDRHAPPEYLQRRGVNLWVLPAAPDESAALRNADFALRVDAGTWMPINAVDREYVLRSFPADRLVARQRVDSSQAQSNHLLVDGAAYDGVQLLATFEPDVAGLPWTCTGVAAVRETQPPLAGGIGKHHLSTATPAGEAAEQGTARSGAFVAAPGTALVLFLAGERALGLTVDLCRGDEVVRAWAPADRGHLQPIACALDPWSGQELHLEVHDRGPGWLALDHCLLARKVEDPRAVRSREWSPAPPPLAGCVTIAPLHSAGGRTNPGPTELTLTNPLPCAIEVAVALVAGPLGSSLLCGPWSTADGASVLRIPPGATVHMHAFLRLDASTPVDRQPFTVRLCVRPDVPNGPNTGATLEVELLLSWREP